jgi:hypothetical protein
MIKCMSCVWGFRGIFSMHGLGLGTRRTPFRIDHAAFRLTHSGRAHTGPQGTGGRSLAVSNPTLLAGAAEGVGCACCCLSVMALDSSRRSPTSARFRCRDLAGVPSFWMTSRISPSSFFRPGQVHPFVSSVSPCIIIIIIIIM